MFYTTASNHWSESDVLSAFCRYFFPTFENDSLLCALTDADGSKPHEEDTSCAVNEVIAEDLPDVVSSLALQ